MSVFLAEFIGTAILVVLGDGVVANVVLGKTKGNNSGWIVITAGWAFAVTVAVYCVNAISGAHLIIHPFALKHEVAAIAFVVVAMIGILAQGKMLGSPKPPPE